MNPNENTSHLAISYSATAAPKRLPTECKSTSPKPPSTPEGFEILSGYSALPFAVYVRNENHRPRLVKLIAACGPLDVDNPAPAITIIAALGRQLTAKKIAKLLAVGQQFLINQAIPAKTPAWQDAQASQVLAIKLLFCTSMV